MPAQSLWAVDLPGWLVGAALAVVLLSIGLAAFVWQLVAKRKSLSQEASDSSAGDGPRDSVHPLSQAERRSSSRSWGLPVGILLADDPADSKPLEGWVLNRSPRGLCLSLSKQIEVGKTMNLRPITAPQSIPWVRVEVKYCSPFVNRWKVGCQFIDSPSQDVLLLFG